MTKFGTVKFEGKSGTSYEFTAYERGSSFNKIGAVYFVTKRTKSQSGSFSHTRIYVGETGNLSERMAQHHRKDCFDQHGANCICVYPESDDMVRLAIEKDIMENYDLPCNLE